MHLDAINEFVRITDYSDFQIKIQQKRYFVSIRYYVCTFCSNFCLFYCQNVKLELNKMIFLNHLWCFYPFKIHEDTYRYNIYMMSKFVRLRPNVIIYNNIICNAYMCRYMNI